MKNFLLCSLLALLLAPGAVAADSTAAKPAVTEPAATDLAEAPDGRRVPPSSACGEPGFSRGHRGAEDFATWLERIGAESFQPDAAQRMAVPSCPDVQPCGDGCVEGEGPCFLKPLGSSECCTPDGCFRCEGGAEIFVISCPCLGAGCPRQSQELACG